MGDAPSRPVRGAVARSHAPRHVDGGRDGVAGLVAVAADGV